MKTTRNLLVMMALLAASLLGTGCIIEHHDDGTDWTGGSTYDWAELDFRWTCAGVTCADAGVMTTRVELSGTEFVTVESPIGATGVALQNHAPGAYDYHIVALSPSRTVLFERYGSLYARSGSNSYNVTLLPPTASATVNFTWSCGGAVCADVGVASTVVELTGAAIATHETRANGMSIGGLPSGAIDFHIVGLSPSRVVLYEAYGSLNAWPGDNDLDVHLGRP